MLKRNMCCNEAEESTKPVLIQSACNADERHEMLTCSSEGSLKSLSTRSFSKKGTRNDQGHTFFVLVCRRITAAASDFKDI